MAPPQTQPSVGETTRLLGPLAAEQGVHPTGAVDGLATGIWESDQELDDFLAFVRRSRDADLS